MANKRDDSSKKHINEIRVSKLKLNLKDEEKIFNKINEHLTDKLSLKKINKETFIKQKWSNIEYKNVSVNIRYALFAWMNYDEKAIVEDNSWFNFLNILGLDDNFEQISSEYKSINKGIISIFHIGSEFYFVTFGRGSTYVDSFCEGRFGIEMTKKLISEDGDLRRIFQKETGGESVILDDIMRTLKNSKKNKYKPDEDFSNATRILKEISGKVKLDIFFDKNSLFNPINKGKPGYRGLFFSGNGTNSLHLKIDKIDKILFFELIDRIYYFDTKVKVALKIPELLKISGEIDLHDKLLEEFNKRVLDDDNDEFSISLTILENIKEEFYENEYIFEKAIIRNTNIPNKQLSFNSLSETFSYIEDIKISKLNTHIKNLNDFEILINYKEKGFDRAKNRTITLEELIEGQLYYSYGASDKEICFFKYGSSFYEPNKDLFYCINKRLSDLVLGNLVIKDVNFLNPWETTINNISHLSYYTNRWIKAGREYKEAAYNALHDEQDEFYTNNLTPIINKKGYHCFDLGCFKNRDLNGIELCDIFIKKTFQLIHIKKASGAKLRELFSQGVIATMAIKDIKNGNGTEAAKIFNKHIGSTKISAGDLVHKMSVVFGIYSGKNIDINDDDEILGFFSKSDYAKFELVRTYQDLNSIGVGMNIYFIRSN